MSTPELCSRAQGGGGRGCGGHGEAQAGAEIRGTDLDNPSSGQTPASCPRGLILGGWEEVQETQKRMAGLAQQGAEDGSGEQAHPLLASMVLGPHDSRDSAGAVKPRSRGSGCP